MRFEKVSLIRDNVAVPRCTVSSGSNLVSNLTAVTDVVTVAGNLGLSRASGSFIEDGVAVGDRITGTGIASGARVVAVDTGRIIMTLPASASGTVTVSFYAIGFIESGLVANLMADVAVGVGAQFAASTVISTVASETQLTLSANAAAAARGTLNFRSHIKATLVVVTPAVALGNCAARQVSALLKAGNAVNPAGSGWEVSYDGGVTFGASGTILFQRDQIVTGASLASGAGDVLSAKVTSGAGSNIVLPATHARYTITGHGTNQIDAVTIDAYIARED